MEGLLRQVVCAARSLAGAPLLAAVAIASLALGIGANVLIFSILDTLFLKPLAFENADRLAVIWTISEEAPEDRRTSSVSTFYALQEEASASFESIGAFNGGACGARTLGFETDGMPAERLSGQTFSMSLFGTLGVEPLIGRALVQGEDAVDDQAPVVLISHAVWQRRFGSDPGILGRTIRLDRIPTTIVGVLPRGFDLFGYDTDFIAPLCVTRAQVESRVGGLTVVARLTPDATIAQAQAEVDGISRGLAEADPERHARLSYRVEPLQTAVYGNYAAPLLLLQGAVGFVLLIACANVAGLLLARATIKRSEIATRMVLGATWARAATPLVAESLLCTLIGGAVGLLLAWVGRRAFVELAPLDFPVLEEMPIGSATFVFILLVVLCAACISVLPALWVSKRPLIEPIRGTAHGATETRASNRLRRAMVGGQIALSFVLLTGAVSLLDSFAGALSTDTGVDPGNLLMFDFRITREDTISPAGRYRGAGLWNVSTLPSERIEEVLERLELLPGVSSVAATSIPPFSSALRVPLVIEGKETASLPGQERQDTASYRAITRGYFESMSIPLLDGRDFNAFDRGTSAPSVIVNEAFAKRYFPGRSAVGRRVTLDLVPDEQPREIVGVVGNTLEGPMQDAAEPTIYVPHQQQSAQWPGPYWPLRAGMFFLVKTNGPPLQALPSITRSVAEVAPGIPVAGATTVEQTLVDRVADLRAYAEWLGSFGIMASLLAAVGIYGVLAFTVAERARDIGIRLALGCSALNAAYAVLLPLAYAVVAGLTIGVVSAWLLSRVLMSALPEVNHAAPVTYLVVTAVLAAVALFACVVPARRAMGVDPVVVLKHE